MKRASWRGWVVFFAVSLFIMSLPCIVLAADIDPAIGQYAQGKYLNKVPPFSLQLPSNWVVQNPQGKEMVRIANNNAWFIPVVTIGVVDLLKDAPPLESDAVVDDYIKEIKKQFPQSSRHRVEFKQMVQTSDGTPALTFILKWKYNEQTVLVTAVLMARKAEKSVSLQNTHVMGGDTTPEDLLKMLKTVTFM